MQQQSLVHETMTINPRDYFVKRPRDAKKIPQRVEVRYRHDLLTQLMMVKASVNML